MLVSFEHYNEYILEANEDIFADDSELILIDESKGSKKVNTYISKGPMVVKSRRKFKELLSKYIVTFKFLKRGSTPGTEVERKAVGTTNLELIPASKQPQGKRKTPPHQVCFWDLEKEEWRSLRSFKFIKLIKTEKNIKELN